jgi:prepilin-type processing-associated H-X9-DG protein
VTIVPLLQPILEQGLDYGYNIMASDLGQPRQGRRLVMDYQKSIIDFDGFPLPDNNDDDADRWLPKYRHRKKINVLMSDGSVQAMALAELQPMLNDEPNPL